MKRLRAAHSLTAALASCAGESTEIVNSGMMLEWLSTLDPVLPSISGDQDAPVVELYDSFGKMSIDLGGNPGSLPSSFDLLPGRGHDTAQPATAKPHQREHMPCQQSQLEPQRPAPDETTLPQWPQTPQVPQQANNIVGAVSLTPCSRIILMCCNRLPFHLQLTSVFLVIAGSCAAARYRHGNPRQFFTAAIWLG